MTHSESISQQRLANKAQAAEFFGCSLPTVDAWLRAGAPVVQRGSRGVSWVLDLGALSQWLGAAGASDLQRAQAEHEQWLARLAEQRFRQRASTLLDRAGVEQAAATVLGTVAQTVRSIPDNLERAAGLTGAQAEECRRMTDGLCLSLQDKFRVLAGLQAELPA